MYLQCKVLINTYLIGGVDARSLSLNQNQSIDFRHWVKEYILILAYIQLFLKHNQCNLLYLFLTNFP